MEFIYDYMDEHQRTPVLREIMRTVPISSTSEARRHLHLLQEAGYILVEPHIARGIRIRKPRRGPTITGKTVPIPFLGYIAAGQPIPAPDLDLNPYVAEGRQVLLDRAQLPTGSLKSVYALAVKGKSMLDALIDDGDVVIVRYQPSADIGDCVVAYLRDDKTTTLKYYHTRGNRVELRPANPDFKPIVKVAADVEIQGKVLLVIRGLKLQA